MSSIDSGRDGKNLSIYHGDEQTCQEIDRTVGETEDVEVRASLNTALTKLHQAEDAIVRALGDAARPTLSRTQESS